MIFLSPLLQKVFVAGILCTGYGFGVSTSIYAYTGRRGLTFKWGLDGIAFTFMSLGALGGTVAGAMLLYNVFCTIMG